MKTASWILWVCILIAIFFLGRCSKRCEKVETVKVETVTETRVDTITVVEPVETVRTVIRRETIAAPADTVYLPGDTVRIEVPIETKEYRDSLYALQIEGYRPRLNWVEVYPRTEYIYRTETKTISKPLRRWSLGPSVSYGYDIKNNRWVPSAGVSVHYALWSW
ncbi:MAG: hypothetical protein LIP10_11505 [Clostridiales bacterium]|nr:hypothetical protein [Clostridiales bacterium]